MSTPNTSRLELQRGEPIVTPGQHLESGRSRAWAAGRTWRQALGQCPAQKSLGRLGLGLRGKQLAPAARADVALDEFARIRRLEVDAAVAALVALGRVLIIGRVRAFRASPQPAAFAAAPPIVGLRPPASARIS